VRGAAGIFTAVHASDGRAFVLLIAAAWVAGLAIACMLIVTEGRAVAAHRGDAAPGASASGATQSAGQLAGRRWSVAGEIARGTAGRRWHGPAAGGYLPDGRRWTIAA
jgi:hypothetical protein